MDFSQKKWMAFFRVCCVTLLAAVLVNTEESITDEPNTSTTDKRAMVHLKNFVGSDLSVDCKLCDKEMGQRTLKDHEGLSISFKTSSDGKTSVWCTVSWDGKNRRFPVYGDGAGRDNNVVDVYGNGIFVNKMQIAKFS